MDDFEVQAIGAQPSCDLVGCTKKKSAVLDNGLATNIAEDAEAVSGAHKQSRSCCGDVHEAVNDALSCRHVAEPGTVVLLERLHAARCEGDEVKVIIDGIKMATIEAEKMVDGLPLEGSFALRRKLEELRSILQNCLSMAPEQRTIGQCTVLMTMVMKFLVELRETSR